MNLHHMKYAVEVAACGSISKAAETLFVAQPNLSRAMRELEAELGFEVFIRSSKGMKLTPTGELFISYAEGILRQVEEMERVCKDGAAAKKRFSISVPRASYIAQAFVNLTKKYSGETVEYLFNETSSANAITNLLSSDYNMAVIRYPVGMESYYKAVIKEKNLETRLSIEYKRAILMNRDSMYAHQKKVTLSELQNMTEIIHGDMNVPSLSTTNALKDGRASVSGKCIYIFERGIQFELLSENTDAYMIGSPVPKKMLEAYGLVQLAGAGNKTYYRDELICKKGYQFSELDQAFIQEMKESMKQCMDDFGEKCKIVE